jgi:hypothetical protein
VTFTLLLASFLLASLASPTFHAAAPPGENFPAFTLDGAWCWFTEPRAISKNGKTYAGWVTEDGSLEVASLDELTGEISRHRLRDQFYRDDHCNPALMFQPDGRLAAFYSIHNGPRINVRVAEWVDSIDSWKPEESLSLTSLVTNRGITYPTPALLTKNGGETVLFFRGTNWKPIMSRSVDRINWTPAKILVTRGDRARPYFKIAVGKTGDRIHIAFTDGHPRDEANNSVYYVCYRDGRFFRADGAAVAGVDDLPLAFEKCDVVYDGRNTGVPGWVWDIAEDKDGRPVIVYATFPEVTDHRYGYARWDGKRWANTELCAAGGWFPRTRTERQYSGGLALDQENPSVVYLSRPVEQVREIERWETRDGGRTWKSRPVTANSKYDNVRPVAVRHHSPGGPAVLWMSLSGRYESYSDYLTSIHMDRTGPRLWHYVRRKSPRLFAMLEPLLRR